MANSRFKDYINPVVSAIDELGGSARPAEVYKQIARALDLSDEILNEEKVSGGSRFGNQVDWARFFLAKAGYIDSSIRGVWSLTEPGRNLHARYLRLGVDRHSPHVRTYLPRERRSPRTSRYHGHWHCSACL